MEVTDVRRSTLYDVTVQISARDFMDLRARLSELKTEGIEVVIARKIVESINRASNG